MRKVKLGDSVTQKLGKVHSLQKEDQNVFCLAPSPLLFWVFSTIVIRDNLLLILTCSFTILPLSPAVSSFNRNIRRLNKMYLSSEKKLYSLHEKKWLLNQHRMHITALEREVKDKEQVKLRDADVYEIVQEHKAATYFKSMR